MHHRENTDTDKILTCLLNRHKSQLELKLPFIGQLIRNENQNFENNCKKGCFKSKEVSIIRDNVPYFLIKPITLTKIQQNFIGTHLPFCLALTVDLYQKA